MAEQIKDGTGSGYLTKVDSDNRFYTRSVTEPEEFFANQKGNAYNLNTGIVTLTDDNETTLFYMKNNEEKAFVITATVIAIWASDGDGLDMLSTIVRNPTTGGIITNANDVDINSNRNYGSSNTLAADVYKGATSETLVNGEDHILVRVTEESRSFIAINERLPKGTSLAVNITPPTSNTSMNCYVAVVGYLE